MSIIKESLIIGLVIAALSYPIQWLLAHMMWWWLGGQPPSMCVIVTLSIFGGIGGFLGSFFMSCFETRIKG